MEILKRLRAPAQCEYTAPSLQGIRGLLIVGYEAGPQLVARTQAQLLG
jgi:hypothetical protein